MLTHLALALRPLAMAGMKTLDISFRFLGGDEWRMAVGRARSAARLCTAFPCDPWKARAFLHLHLHRDKTRRCETYTPTSWWCVVCVVEQKNLVEEEEA